MSIKAMFDTVSIPYRAMERIALFLAVLFVSTFQYPIGQWKEQQIVFSVKLYHRIPVKSIASAVFYQKKPGQSPEDKRAKSLILQRFSVLPAIPRKTDPFLPPKTAVFALKNGSIGFCVKNYSSRVSLQE